MNFQLLASWLQDHGEALQIGGFFAIFAALAAVERVVPFRRPTPRGTPRWRTNLCLTLLNLLTLSALPASFITSAVFAREQGIGLLNAWEPAAGIAAGVTLLVRAFLSFFTHFLMHKWPWLWRVHRVHHLDTELDVSTTVRFHPLEFVAGLAIGLPAVVALGLTPWVLIGYEVADAVITVFSHSNLRLPPALERVIRYVIVTPDLHRVHHSSWQPETDSNFGAVFPIWDLLLGTFRTSTRVPQASMELGLEQVRDARVDQLGWLLWSPLASDLPRARIPRDLALPTLRRPSESGGLD